MASEVSTNPASQGRTKFFVGGAIIIAAIVYLIVTSTQASAQYFLTVEELETKGSEVIGRDVRISGAVIGETIMNDTAALTLTFTVAHIPGDNDEIEEQGGLANVLHDATLDPMAPRLQVVYYGVKPDLLKNEAQAIMTGTLNEEGVFIADELLLKCPTRYDEAVPEQADS